MEQLEEAANIIMSPPNLVTLEQRQAAESVIVQFRGALNPYNMCREILECSKSEYVLFETANLLGLSIAKDWSDVCNGPAIELKQYLVQYLVSNPLIFYSVKGNLLKTVAFITENEDTPYYESKKFSEEIIQLLNADEPNLCSLGCSMAQALIQEKHQTLDYINYIDNFETHRTGFESGPLKEMYITVLRLLSLASSEAVVTSEMVPVLLNLVLLAEDILSWPFFHVNTTGRMTSSVNSQPFFSPSIHWGECVLSKETVELFFLLYSKCKENLQLGHHLMTCLVQLSSLTGVCLSDRKDKMSYLRIVASCLHTYIAEYEILQSDALGIACMFMKISLSHFDKSHKCSDNDEMVDVFNFFAHDIFTLTIKYIEKAAEERGNDSEDQLYTEGLDKLLIGVEAVTNFGCTRRYCDYMPRYHCRIFHNYLMTHLSAPDGSRRMIEDKEYLLEDPEPDYVKYSIQISLVMQIGIKEAKSCLLTMAEMMEKKCEQLRIVLSLDNPTAGMDELFDDIYWLLMMAGQVMANPYCHDELRMANRIWYNSFPIEDLTNAHILLTNLDKKMDQLPNVNPASVNPYIRILAAVFRIWKLDVDATAKANSVLLSPEVANTIVWFMKHFFLKAYGHVVENSTFGPAMTEEIHAFLLNFTIEAICTALQKRSSEPALVANYNRLLFVLPTRYIRSHIKITEMPNFAKLIQLSNSGELVHVSPDAQIGLLKGLVQCSLVYSKDPRQKLYWQQILESHVANFRNIVQNDGFSRNSCDEIIRRRVIFHLDNLTAICGGVSFFISDCIYDLAIEEGLQLALVCMDVYHNYKDVVESAMQAFLKASQIMPLIGDDHYHDFLRKVMELRNIYSRRNIGKTNYHNNSDDEDKFTTLLLLLKILAVTLQPQENVNLLDEVKSCTIYSLGMVTDLMNVDVMQDPDICLQYFTLLYDTKFSTLMGDDLFKGIETSLKNILTWIELGLNSYGSQISNICIDILTDAIRPIYIVSQTHRMRLLFQPFMQIMLKLIFAKELCWSALDNADCLLTSLIAWYKADFDEFMTRMIASQTSKNLQMKLRKCCVHLQEVSKRSPEDMSKAMPSEEIIAPYKEFVKLAGMCGARVKFPCVPDSFSMTNMSNALISH